MLMMSPATGTNMCQPLPRVNHSEWICIKTLQHQLAQGRKLRTGSVLGHAEHRAKREGPDHRSTFPVLKPDT